MFSRINSHHRSGWSAALVVVGLLIGGCSSDGGTAATGAPPSGADSAASSAGSAPAGGPASGNLVVGITSDPDTLFPWKATQFQAVNILGLVYGTLTELDQNLAVVPGIAEKWEYTAGGKTLTLHLRTGVTFADGSPLTSADVKYSLDTILLEKTAAVARSTLASVTKVDTPDPATVSLTLSAPDAGLLAGFATVNLAILKNGATENDLTSKTNGNGPFGLTDRKPNQSLTLTTNPKFWRGPAKLASLKFRVIPDETSVWRHCSPATCSSPPSTTHWSRKRPRAAGSRWPRPGSCPITRSSCAPPRRRWTI